MQIRPALHGALLALWICLFTSSLCYGDDKTLQAAAEPGKVFSELTEDGHKVPTLKKPFAPLQKIPAFKKPIPEFKKKHPSPSPQEEKIFIPKIFIPPIRSIPKFKPPTHGAP